MAAKGLESQNHPMVFGPGARKAAASVLLLVAAVFGLGLLAKWFELQNALRQLLRWIAEMGPLGPVMFVGAYAVAVILLIPGSIFTVAAGILFGVTKGTLYSSLASMAGATAAFFIGRYVLRGWMRRRLKDNKVFNAIDRAVGIEGWKVVGLTRLSPIFPFNFLNYAFGVTQVDFVSYFFASWLFMLPGTLMYVYAGSMIGDLANIDEARPSTNLQWTFYSIGLVATIAVTVLITRKARRALNSRFVNDGNKPSA